MKPFDPRSAPDAAFIASMRSRFSVEHEIDRVLTDKMERRGGPGFVGIELTDITAGASDLIRTTAGDDFSINNCRWLHGGASKLQAAFDLSWFPPGAHERQTIALVLRMALPESIVETSRRREYAACKQMRDVVPVPECYWLDDDATYLPHPAMIYAFNEGVTRPVAQPAQQVTGIGINFGPDLREPLAHDFITHLAAIHRADPEPLLTNGVFDRAEVGNNLALLRQIDWWWRVWEEDHGEAVPLVPVAAQWLRANAPALDHVSVVHGDFRSGNFLFSEHEQSITAWLDWELAVLGDRHQDLTWTMSPYFGHYAEDGHTFLVSGLVSKDEFLQRYAAISGLSVDPERLAYFSIFNTFVTTVHMFASAYRVAAQSKTHQDIVVAWLAMIGPIALANLADQLEEAMQ